MANTQGLVRAAKKTDIASISALLKEGDDFHAHLLPSHFKVSKKGRAETEILRLVSDKDTLLLLSIHGKVVRGLLHTIEAVVVAQSERRSGTGSRLLEKAEEWAVQMGVDRITLNVFTKNKPAMEFYQSLGYEMISVKMERPPRTTVKANRKRK